MREKYQGIRKLCLSPKFLEAEAKGGNLAYVVLIILFKETNHLYAETMKFINVIKMEFLLKTTDLVACNSA